jgi:hypothetical protein
MNWNESNRIKLNEKNPLDRFDQIISTSSWHTNDNWINMAIEIIRIAVSYNTDWTLQFENNHESSTLQLFYASDVSWK